MSESPFISDINKDSFDTEVIARSHDTPVFVDFWAGWCNPCKILMPLLASLAQDYEGKFYLAKIDSDVERSLAEKYGVRSLPTVKIFRHGEVVDEFTGVIPEGDIRQLIEKYIVRESDGLYADAIQALKNGDIVAAKSTMQKAMDLDPDQKKIILGMVDIHIKENDIDTAEALIHKLPMNVQTDEDVERIKAQLLFASEIKNAPPIEILEETISGNPKDKDSLYQLGSRYAINGDHEKALVTFLKLMMLDKTYNDGAPRKAMLSIFNILGGGPLVNRYRSKMASALL